MSATCQFPGWRLPPPNPRCCEPFVPLCPRRLSRSPSCLLQRPPAQVRVAMWKALRESRSIATTLGGIFVHCLSAAGGLLLHIVLASSSPYRRELLARLKLRFEVLSPEIDESPEKEEAPSALVTRLSRLKARAVARLRPHALIIGSDQVAALDNRILGKPGHHDANVRQLLAAAGRRVRILTGVALLNATSGKMQSEVVETRVLFRSLSEEQAEAYVRTETPYDCAGGFRAEGLGIALFQEAGGVDPSALIGLPLITLVSMLRREGIDPLIKPSHPET